MSNSNPILFQPLRIRDCELRNRLVLAPMMQYRATDGYASDWHVVHLGKFALGGFAVVMTEVVAVQKRGRISYGDLGIWSDDQIAGLKRCVDYIHAEGALAAIQIGHAGRKASVRKVFDGGGPIAQGESSQEPPWQVVGPSPLAVGPGYPVPTELSLEEIEELIADFGQAARRAREAGFDIIEIHGAHGYLVSSFLSPISNVRTDQYGGDLVGRMRFALDVVEAVRKEWPEDKPLFFRISAEDGGGDQGWQLDDTLVLAPMLAKLGVDVIDCSSGGISGAATVANSLRGPGYQVPYADQVKNQAGVSAMAVGLILTAEQANDIVMQGKADLVAIGRQALYDPFWPLHARQALGQDPQFENWNDSSAWWLRKRADALNKLGLPMTGQPPQL